MPDSKKSKFDNIDYSSIADNIVNNLSTYEPENFSGNLDLRSSTLENGVPAALIGNQNSEEYLNELKAQRQGFLDKAANGTLQALNTAVVGTIGNTAGVVHGLSDMANGQSFFDNSTFKFMDEWDESVKEALPLYRSNKEMTGSIGDRVMDQDFLFGDLFQGVGFVASSLVPGAGWAKLGKIARTALLANKIGKLNKLAATGNLASKEFLALNKFIDLSNKSIGTLSNMGAATFGRIYESRLEAKGTYDEVYNKSYDKKVQELKGTGISDEEVLTQADLYAEKQATDARNFTFGANMLLAIPDYYQFSKIFSNGASKALTVNKIIKNNTTGLFEQAVENAPKGILGKVSKALPKNLLENAAVESIEEGIQYNIGETSKKLAEKDFDMDLADYSSEFFNQSIKNMSSPEFLTSALAGGIIGGGMSALQKNTNQATKTTKDQNTAQAVQDLNEYTPLLRKVQNAQDNLNKYTQLEKQKTEVINTINDPSTTEESKIKAKTHYRQLDNLQFSQAVQAHVQSDTLDSFLDEIELFGNSTKDQLREDFGIETFEYNEDGTEISPKEIADKKIKRAKSLASSYQFINSNYTNLSQASKNELYNVTSTINYNDEKLDIVSNKITKLELEKSNAELTDKPFNQDKAVKLDNLKKEKEHVSNIQKSLGKRYDELRTGKAEDREVKTEANVETKTEVKVEKEQPILSVVTSTPTSKFKGSDLEIIEDKNDRISFRVKGNKTIIKLSKNEFNKQVLGQTPSSQELILPATKNSKVETDKQETVTVPANDLVVSSNDEYSVDDVVVVTTEVETIKPTVNKPRKALGTRSFFNSPLFFVQNGKKDKLGSNRNEILSDPNWQSKFRIKAHKGYAKSKDKALPDHILGDVEVYTNGGENALDLTVEYNNSQDSEKPNWISYGALPYSGMLRDNKGKPFDFSLMTYEEFNEKFYVVEVKDKNGVNQEIEYSSRDFDLLKIQQQIFNEFEILVKQSYNTTTEEEVIIPTETISTGLSYFIRTGELALSDLSSVVGFTNSKLLTISDGKVNNDLTSTSDRLEVPEYFTETFGTSNKTYINVQLENGINFWTIAFIKGNNKKLEEEVISDLTNVAINYNSTPVTPETDIEVQEIIKNLNGKVFITNNLKSYLNFRVFPLENKSGYKIKVQLKTDEGSKYIDIFNPEVTVKEDGSRLSTEELSTYFSYDNISKLINTGFAKQSIDINPNSFVSNYVKGNPKLEDLVIPINNIELNLKFDYHNQALPTLTSTIVLPESDTPEMDDTVEKEIAEQKAKSETKRKTGFDGILEERNQNEMSRVLSNDIFPLKGNEVLYAKYKLLTKEGVIQYEIPNTKKTIDRLASLNQSPYYTFVLKPVPNGKYKIFIKNKVLYSKENNIDNTPVSREYLEDMSSKIKKQYNLDVRIESIFDNEGRQVKGLIKNNIVYLNPNNIATKDTPIHEVIHPFLELVKQNNSALYKNLISELKKSEIGKKVIGLVNSKYSDLNNEEILDESLVTVLGYYSSGVISKEKNKDFLDVIKAFFKKVVLYIKNIFGKDLDISTISSTSTISELSDIIVSSKIDLNNLNINKSKESKLDMLTADISIKLINTIGAKTVERITEKPNKQNLNTIIDSIIEQTRLENNTRNVDASNIEDLDERKAYKLKRHLISEALTIPFNIEAIKKSVIEDILKMHYSEDTKFSEEDDTVQNVNDESDIRDYEEGVENSGGWNNVDPEIRNFIYYNTFSYIDEAGYNITEAVDGLSVYKAIQTALADQQAENFLPILESIAKYNVQVKSVLDNFKIKSGLDSKGEKTLTQSNFLNKFYKSFENSKLEYLQVYTNKKGKVVVGSANKSTTSGRLFNRWKNNYIVNKNSIKVNSEKLQKTINSIGSEVLTNPTQIVNELYNGLSAIGIEVSKPYLEYSFVKESPLAIFENQGYVKLDFDTISKLLYTIKNDNDIFESGDKKGNSNILKKVADADALFRTDAIEDTYRDSRGKLRNSYTKQNLVTKSINQWKNKVKDLNFIRDIKEDKNNYYHYNYLFNNKLFTSEAQIQEVFKNADLALIGDIRDGVDKFTTRNISSEAFTKMQIALYRNATEPKDIITNSNFPFEARTNSRQKFAFVDFGKISDKNTEIALRLPIDDRFVEQGKITNWFVDQLYNTVFLQEYTKLKSYDNKGRLYYSKEKPLILNDSIIKEIKSGNAWSNLSVLNNKVLDEYATKYNKPEYLELKNLLSVEDLSTKKELIKSYLKDSFSKSFENYLNTLRDRSNEINIDKNEETELGNMYTNNFLLRTSFQQLVKGDLAISKNNDDDLKRNGRVTAYGDSGKDYNEGTNTSYKVLYLTDAKRYKVKENNNFRNATELEIKAFETGFSDLDIITLDSDDAGARMTVKHLINTLQRLGRLTNKTREVLNKVDNGELLTEKESSLIDLIPMKGVHAGVDKYLKMSQFTLTKQLTSIQDKDGNWIARTGREQLHNLRELMESTNTGLAIPKSGSKSISRPLFNQEQLFTSSVHDITNNSEDITWEDWRLQVENESGKTEISQPVQIIQMIDGSSKIDQSIKDKLQELYVQQREGDFNDALNIANGNTEFGKQALIDKFQDNAINSASDANTIEYLSGENGEMNYNPNLPHLTFTFENYFTSHFNKNVLAQKIPGYKVTLAPATGIQVIRDTKTGEIIMSDIYEKNKKDFNSKQYQVSDLRIHSGISKYAECLMTKAQASKLGLKIGDSITEEVFKMIGTRLPCQGYSSMIPLKVVDFLPEFYGSTIIAPEEIVYIAGSDYDVDSLFIMRKEAYLDTEGNTRYYTFNEADDNLRWQDYKQYLTKGNKNITSKLREGLSIDQALKAFGYPTNKKEFLAKEKELGKMLNSKYAVTNELVNVYESILTNPDLLNELQQPVDNGGFDVVGKTIYYDLQGQGSSLNYFHNSDNALKKHFELATQGKRDVGPAANGNSISSFFKKHKIALKEELHFVFNGKAVTNVFEDDVIDFDFIYDTNGKPVLVDGIPLTSEIKNIDKQSVHSGLMSITVDNQKDPVCFMLNLDPANVGIASTMIHLGIGGKGFIAAFMNSKSVKYDLPSEMYDGIEPTEVTKETLVKSMMDKSTVSEEAGIALLYKRLKDISNTTFNVSKLIATNKGIGSTFSDLDSIIDAKRQLKNKNRNVFANIDKALKDNKNINFNLQAVDTIDRTILSKEFLSRSEFITDLKEFLNKTTFDDIQLDKDFSGYLISNILTHNRNIDFNKLSNLSLPNNKNSIVSKYYDLVKRVPEFKNNVLIKFLTVERGNKSKADLLYFNQSIKLNGKSLEKLTDGYRELIQSDNTEVSDFAKDMFYYLIVKDNMKFTINSFGRLLAPEMFKKISGELKIAVEGIIEKDDNKLMSITGKNYDQLRNEFINTYIRWVGNSNKFINYDSKKLKKHGISLKRNKDNGNISLNFDIDKLKDNQVLLFMSNNFIFDLTDNNLIDYPQFIKSGTSLYILKELDGINAEYELLSYIGLPIISPYHLDIATNEEMFKNANLYLNDNTASSNIENNNETSVNKVVSYVDDSNAESPAEYSVEETVSSDYDFGNVPEPGDKELQEIYDDSFIPSEEIKETNIVKPSDTLQEAVDQNIVEYSEQFFNSLTNEEKGKLANRGIPRMFTPSDIMKDFNKSKNLYNNDFNKYLEYLRNCRL